MAVCAWLLEKDENAIVLGLHLLPRWYPDTPEHHLAEHEGVAEQMDILHLQKIDLSDEIFVVNFNDYIGDSTRNEIAHAQGAGKRLRYFMKDKIGVQVLEMMQSSTAGKTTGPVLPKPGTFECPDENESSDGPKLPTPGVMKPTKIRNQW